MFLEFPEIPSYASCVANWMQLVKSFQMAPESRREPIGMAILEPLYPLIRGFVRADAPYGDDEDITQETMLAIVKSLDRFRCESDAHFRNWAYRIAKNRIIDFRRARAKDLSLVRIDALENLEGELASDGKLGVEEKEIVEALRQAEPDIFDVIWARLYFDVDWRDLAKEFNSTPDALRVKVRRAVQRLRKVAEDLV